MERQVNESKSLPPDKVRVHLLMVFSLLRFYRSFALFLLISFSLSLPFSPSFFSSLILHVRALVLWLVIFLSANEFPSQPRVLTPRGSFLYFFNLKTERLHEGQLSGLKNSTAAEPCYLFVVNPRFLTLTFDDITFFA